MTSYMQTGDYFPNDLVFPQNRCLTKRISVFLGEMSPGVWGTEATEPDKQTNKLTDTGD